MDEEKTPQFEALLDYLRRSRGFDFTGYKRLSLMRRICKRMQMVGIEDFLDYRDYLEVHPEEFTQLFNTILINVTAFFRDEPAWDCLRQEIIPRILAGKAPEEPLRIWSAGCASGEEPYSLVMLLAEALGIEALQRRAKIFATDVDEEALAQARQGFFTEKQAQPIPADLRKKYFAPAGERLVFHPELRCSIIFGRHDLFQDAPISRLDLLVCRNTIMYFNAEAQAKVVARFHFALKEDGYLFLGRSEMLLTRRLLFSPVELKQRIFAKARQDERGERISEEMQTAEQVAEQRQGQPSRWVAIAFDAGLVAQVVVDVDGRLALANARSRDLFKLSRGDIGRPLQDLELSYRPADLRSLIEQAASQRRSIKLSAVERQLADGSRQYLDVQATPLVESDARAGGLPGVSISFEDVTRRQQLQAEKEQAVQELQTIQEELQSTNEELETTNEELHSTNEELETTNEELQSTNEELETMNEELQSTNEELQAINTELQERTRELNAANDFQKSILGGLRVGLAVVNARFEVIAWNPRAQDLWGLRSEEALGRSILDLDIGLPVEQIPFQSFLAGKADYQELSIEARNRRGKALHCHLTCSLLCGPQNERRGVVLTMEELPETGAHPA